MTHLKQSGKKLPHSWQFEALGTHWSIDTPVELTGPQRGVISQRIETFDKIYSRFRDDSLVQRLRRPGMYEFPEDVVPLLTLYKKMYEITDGKVTPLIGSQLEQAGYDTQYSFNAGDIMDIPSFDILNWDGNMVLRPDESVVLDVGAAGKGYLVDIIGEILAAENIHEYTVDASGDVRHRGSAEVVGLEHPGDPTKIIGVANLANKSLCASAVNRRTWQGYHHVFDPDTKQSTSSMIATWVIAESALLADALTTALFFVPAKILQKEFDFTYVTIDVHGAIDASPDFDGELYI